MFPIENGDGLQIINFESLGSSISNKQPPPNLVKSGVSSLPLLLTPLCHPSLATISLQKLRNVLDEGMGFHCLSHSVWELFHDLRIKISKVFDKLFPVWVQCVPQHFVVNSDNAVDSLGSSMTLYGV